MKALKKHFSVILCVCLLTGLTLPAFAATSSSTANSCETLGLIKGDGSGVTDSYLSQNATRLQAAILILRLMGLEEEAKNFIETDNFIDVGELNDTNKAILAYLKANPELGFVGYGNSRFEPLTKLTASEFYKVLITALGYPQFNGIKFKETIEFAEKTGLTALGAKEGALTVGDLCTGIAEALQTNTKGTDKTLIESLVEKGIFSRETAKAAGFEVPVKPIDQGIIYILMGTVSTPTVSTVSYTAHKLTVKLDCATAGATIYYTYSLGGTAAVPTNSSPDHVSAGTSVEIDDTNVGDTINIKAIAVTPFYENSAVSSYTRNGYIIEAVRASNATLSGRIITLESGLTVEELLDEISISSGANAHMYDDSDCDTEVTSGNIDVNYTLRVSSGYNADDLNDYSFVLDY